MALFFADYSLGMLGLRDGPMKFIYELDSGRSRMFDLEIDPGERLNVAGGNIERARAYRAASARLERGAEALGTSQLVAGGVSHR